MAFDGVSDSKSPQFSKIHISIQPDLPSAVI